MNIKPEINSNEITAGDFNTPLTLMDNSSRQKISKEIMVITVTLDYSDFTFFEHFIPKLQNTHFSPVHIKHFSGQTTYSVTIRASIYSRRPKSHQASFPTETVQH